MKMTFSVPFSFLKGHRFPRSVIGYAVRGYHRFRLSLRAIEDLLTERGITSATRQSPLGRQNFRTQSAAKIRLSSPRPGDKWRFDEVVITIHGKKRWLWRARDGNGDTLETPVRSRQNADATKQFLRKRMKPCGILRVIEGISCDVLALLSASVIVASITDRTRD